MGVFGVLVVLFLHKVPGLLPIVGVLFVPLEEVPDAFCVLTVCGDAFKAGSDNLYDVIIEEGLGIHSTDELAAVKAITIVHQASKRFAEPNGHVGQAGCNQAGEVGLNLVVNVIGMLIKLGMARIRWCNPASQK